MLLFLDSANTDEIREAFSLFPLDGVTTNPTILAREKAPDPAKRLAKIRELIGDKLLFAQLTAFGGDTPYREAEALRKLLGEPLCLKVPMQAELLPVMTGLCARGFTVCATAVYSVPQALLAAKAGAAYVAPYVSHIDNLSEDGPGQAVRMQDALLEQGLDAKVLGASFRVASQISRLFEDGVPAATVTLPMLRTLAGSPSTELECESFRRNWEAVYGGRTLLDYTEIQ